MIVRCLDGVAKKSLLKEDRIMTINIHPNEEIAVAVGTKAPDFTLQDIDHKSYQLSDALQSGPVVLVFYRGDWCAWCQLQTAKLAQSYDKFVDAGVSLWAISPQQQRINKQFGEKRQIPYPILADEDLAVIKDWGLLHELNPDQENIPYPTTYIINEDGSVHWRHLGSLPEDRPTTEEILNALP